MGGGEQMTAAVPPELLGPDLLDRLPAGVQGPGFDRTALRTGMAHVGVGAFHRCHQAEYTDDMLAQRFDRWGVTGINIREPRLADTLGAQAGLYTRLIREGERAEARIIGCMVSVVDSQTAPDPALDVLASAEVDVVTLTVTEKGYCHRPASGELDAGHPDIAHDLANPDMPRSVPGLLLRALELRMLSHGAPVTLMSCDNIPANGAVLGNVVRTMAERRGRKLGEWIAANVGFPSTMVDRIAPATSAADLQLVQDRFGYRDRAVVVGEPYRQWVIENRFAGRRPPWDLAGATFVDDVTAFEHLKMRVLNAAQSTLAYLGLIAGHEHTFEAVADPLLAGFVRRMLIEESVPTLQPVPDISAERYVEQSLERIRNPAIRHRNHQIATDGSQKIVQRLLNPIRERLGRGESIALLSVAVASWMVYLIRASQRFGKIWVVDDPYGARIAGIADRVGRDPTALTREILAVDTIFAADLAGSEVFRSGVAGALDGLLSDEPLAYLRRVCELPAETRLNHRVRSR
jgi:fructuronate reductase